jgi:Flp pilus assembly pilin Flp
MLIAAEEGPMPYPATTKDKPAPANGGSLLGLLRKVHSDERGAVSIETILIIGAIAIPILIFVIKVGWPRIKAYFNKGMDDLETGAGAATQ